MTVKENEPEGVLRLGPTTPDMKNDNPWTNKGPTTSPMDTQQPKTRGLNGKNSDTKSWGGM